MSVPPDLEDHTAAVSDLIVHANVGGEIRATRVRTELDGGRGVGPQALRITQAPQGESPTVARRLPPIAHIPLDRPEFVRHVGPRLVARESVRNGPIRSDDSKERQAVPRNADVVMVRERASIGPRPKVANGRVARRQADHIPVYGNRSRGVAAVQEADGTTAGQVEWLVPDLMPRSVVGRFDGLEGEGVLVDRDHLGIREDGQDGGAN